MPLPVNIRASSPSDIFDLNSLFSRSDLITLTTIIDMSMTLMPTRIAISQNAMVFEFKLSIFFIV